MTRKYAKMINRKNKPSVFFIIAFMSICKDISFAQEIPSSADVGRIQLREKIFSIDEFDYDTASPSTMSMPSAPIPTEAKDIEFVLKNVKFIGKSIFSDDVLKGFYKKYINQEISLKTAYLIAENITKHYRESGYFLSIAFLPKQNIANGLIKIQILEGYVREVELPKELKDNYVVKEYVKHLTNIRPLTSKSLENILLGINNLPGNFVKGTLTEIPNAQDGAVKLVIDKSKKEGSGQISLDNYSSRFLGTNEVSFNYTNSFIPLQQTTLSGINSFPLQRLNHFGIKQDIFLFPDINLELRGNITQSEPGYTLERFEFNSLSKFASIGLGYQLIRQRQENLSLNFSIDARNTDSDILNNTLTRDRIRILRINASYDKVDSLNGYNLSTMTLSQGIRIFDSSRKGNTNLSRAEATPDFRKIELSFLRLQNFASKWSLLFRTAGQLASGPLFSAEEFGYGGQTYGRAFDASEVVGDHGISTAFEVRYDGWRNELPIGFQPFIFHDFARVWNEDKAQISRESGHSIGLGLRTTSELGVNANIAFAMPLVRSIQNPVYGQGNNEPRILLQLIKEF